MTQEKITEDVFHPREKNSAYEKKNSTHEKHIRLNRKNLDHEKKTFRPRHKSFDSREKTIDSEEHESTKTRDAKGYDTSEIQETHLSLLQQFFCFLYTSNFRLF